MEQRKRRGGKKTVSINFWTGDSELPRSTTANAEKVNLFYEKFHADFSFRAM